MVQCNSSTEDAKNSKSSATLNYKSMCENLRDNNSTPDSYGPAIFHQSTASSTQTCTNTLVKFKLQ